MKGEQFDVWSSVSHPGQDSAGFSSFFAYGITLFDPSCEYIYVVKRIGTLSLWMTGLI